MTYEDFQAYCARMGFTECVLTRDQFDECIKCGLSWNGIYGVACDVLADISFDDALAANFYQENDS